jgi:glucose/arabinose dehydrogenase
MPSLRVVGPIVLLAAVGSLAAEKPFGLKRRIPWNDSRVVGSPDPPHPYKAVRSFPKLTIKQPLSLTPEPGTNRLFILQHLNYWAGPGRLVAIDDDQTASRTEILLELDGLAVGLAFHPDYERNGFIFIGLNGSIDGRKMTLVVRYTVNRRPPGNIDPESRKLIIAWPSEGHDGGDLAFGNDGYLYVSAGDGTGGSDLNLTGQRIDDLPGSVLRIDVDHPGWGQSYGVPEDNPFVSRAGARPELWAYGLRNPWRLSIDRETGQLWVGNNGQDLWEQVYLIQKGGNYGWSLSEGSHVFVASRETGPDLAPRSSGKENHLTM